MSSPGRPLLGMILKGYPRISETFISNEILLLEKLGFPIHLFFAAEGLEERIEGVAVTVRDVSGNVILEASSEGPLFFVDVVGGRYTVDAEYAGEKQSQTRDLTGRRYLQLRYIFGE